MARIINITNGEGSGNLIDDTYLLTADVPGYDNCSIDPSKITINENTDTYEFTISASATLTLHVTEEGIQNSTPVEGATFIRTDMEGNEYGTPITTDASGNAVFNNVPYDQTNAPLIYFKQISSDGNHDFDNEVQSTSLTTISETIQIQNKLGEERIIILTDENYENLPIESGILTFTN